MKNTIIPAILLFLANICLAQQQKGDLAIQFSGNYYSQKITFGKEEEKFFAGNIYVKMGKFFTQNLELGVKPNITFFPDFESKIVNNEIQTKKKLKTNFGFGLYGTYSFLTADAKMMPYAGAEISYVPTGKESTVNLGPYAGVKYFLTEKINIDGNMSYLLNLGDTYGRSVDVSIGGLFTFNLGIGVILGKLNP
jgi:hypothetical protein